jgi:hypothetical protein
MTGEINSLLRIYSAGTWYYTDNVVPMAVLPLGRSAASESQPADEPIVNPI